MADERHVLEVDVDDKATSKLHRIANGLDSLGSAAGASEKHLATIDRRLPKMASELRQTAKNMETFRDATKGMGAETSAEVLRAQAALTRLTSWAPRKNGAFSSVQDATNLGQLASFQREYSSALNALNGVVATNTGLTDTNTGATVAATAAAAAHTQSLNATRYALYDVSATLAVFGAATVGVSAATYAASISWERDFANVIRTTGLTGESVDALRKQFIGLQQELPVTSADLAVIGTLAAQMGISAGNVADFTRVTAMFSATAGTSVDETATALARLDSLLPDVEGNYERLASTILKTGVNAVATEQQIIRSVNQIASISRMAGLTTPEVVALSSALSSLGMSPELQRSVVTSSFSKLLTVTSSVSAATEKYGAVLNMTGAQFAKSFKSDAYGTYTRFLEAIASRSDAVTVLQDLGLASQRLTPNLLKVGQNTALFAETLRDTTGEWGESGELARQYGVIAETIAAKLIRLGNSFQGLLVTIGDGGEVFGGIVDGALDLLKVLTDIAANPVANWFLQAGLLVGGFIGVLSLVGAAVSAGFASILAMQTALVGLTASSGTASIGLGALIAQLTAIVPAGTAAASTLGVVSSAATVASKAVALLAPAVAAVVASLALLSTTARVDTWLSDTFGGTKAAMEDMTEILAGGRDLTRQEQDLLREIEKTTGRKFTQREMSVSTGRIDFDTEGWDSWFGEFQRSADSVNLGGLFGVDSSSAIRSLREYDEQLSEIARSGGATDVAREVGRIAAAQGISVDQVLTKLPDVKRELDAYAKATGQTERDVQALAEAEEAAARAAETAAIARERAASSLDVDDLEAYVAAVNQGAAAWFDYKGNLEAAYAVDDPSTKDLNEAGGGLGQFASTLQSQIDGMTQWADGLAELSARGASGLAEAFAAEGPTSRQAVLDSLTLGSEELAQLDANARLAAFLSSAAFAEQFALDNGHLADVYSQVGIEAVQALIAATEGGLTSDEWTSLSLKYGFSIPIDVEVSEADRALTSFRAVQSETPMSLRAYMELMEAENQLNIFRINNSSMTMTVYANMVKNGDMGWGVLAPPGAATGGLASRGGFTNDLPGFSNGGGVHLRGPGTGTSDSFTARVSNGEFINTAASVRYYGAQFFESLNRRQIPRFASGGPVGTAPQMGGGPVTNVNVTQINPVTRDPLKDLRKSSEDLAYGIWS